MDTTIRIIPLLLVLLRASAAEYGDRIKNATITWGGNLVMEESRHAAYAVPVPGYAPPHTELPITFKAPYVNARDYWTESSRRTVLDYVPYSPQDLIPRPLNDGINTFYDLMQQFFGANDPQQNFRRPPGPPPPPHPQRQPYEFEQPFQRPAVKPYYLPRPKPLHASVQKLEPSHFAPHPQNYPQFVKILNDVLAENTYHNMEPVLEKPAFIPDYAVPPTTYKPRNRYERPNSGGPQIFPVSIQDQLPPVQFGQDTRIPYVTESPISTTVATVQTTQQWPVAVDTTPGTRVVFPVQTEVVPLDIAVDVRHAGKSPINNKRPMVFETTTTSPETKAPKETPTTTTETVKIDNELSTITELLPTTQVVTTTPATATTTTSITTTPISVVTLTTSETPLTTESIEEGSPLLNTIEPLEESGFRLPFPKKLHPRTSTIDSTTQSADYVTDLTLQGLNDSSAVHASLPLHSTAFNGSVIGYVIEKFNATAPPPKTVHLDDGLSLDAKILRDTNWDGYQPIIPTTDRAPETTIWTTTPFSPVSTTDEPSTTPVVETTTVLPTTTEPQPEKKEKETAIVSSRITQSISRSSRQRQQSRPTTTQETIITPRTDEITLPESVSPTLSSTTRRGRKYERRNRVHNKVQYSRRKQDDEDVTSLEVVTLPSTETSTRRRKYHRRQRVQNFTQFPDPKVTTSAPVKLGTLSRPFYPKRNRPNVTLSFKRNSKRVTSTPITLEDKEVNEEDNATRRNSLAERKTTSQFEDIREET